jgi:hypothetical protein
MLSLPEIVNGTFYIPEVENSIEYYILEFYNAHTKITRINAVLYILYATIQQLEEIKKSHSKEFMITLMKCITQNMSWISIYCPIIEVELMRKMKGLTYIETEHDLAFIELFKKVYITIEEIDEVYEKGINKLMI